MSKDRMIVPGVNWEGAAVQGVTEVLGVHNATHALIWVILMYLERYVMCPVIMLLFYLICPGVAHVWEGVYWHYCECPLIAGHCGFYVIMTSFFQCINLVVGGSLVGATQGVILLSWCHSLSQGPWCMVKYVWWALYPSLVEEESAGYGISAVLRLSFHIKSLCLMLCDNNTSHISNVSGGQHRGRSSAWRWTRLSRGLDAMCIGWVQNGRFDEELSRQWCWIQKSCLLYCALLREPPLHGDSAH